MQGIVMDIKGDKAVLMKENGMVVEVKNKNYKVGQRVVERHQTYRKYIVMAACFVLCFATAISGYAAYTTPTSYIYVDINPSIRLDINYFNKIIDIVPLNDDAADLLSSYDFKSKNAEECINEIIKSCKEKNYINDDNKDVEIDVSTNKNGLKEKISQMSENLKEEDLSVFVLNINQQENTEAMKYSTSPKRLKAIEEYTNTFGGTLEDNMSGLKGTSVKNIYSQINSKKSENPNETVNTNSSETPKNNITAPKNSYIPKTQKDTTSSTNTQSEISQKRRSAIQSYTDTFGGTLEENTQNLKGVSISEIYDKIENTQNESSQQPPTEDTESENSAADTNEDVQNDTSPQPETSENDTTENNAKRRNNCEHHTRKSEKAIQSPEDNETGSEVQNYNE